VTNNDDLLEYSFAQDQDEDDDRLFLFQKANEENLLQRFLIWMDIIDR